MATIKVQYMCLELHFKEYTGANNTVSYISTIQMKKAKFIKNKKLITFSAPGIKEELQSNFGM